MKYRFMAEQRDAHSVEMMARLLKVTRSGFYAWLKRQPSSREKAEADLVHQVGQIQAQMKRRYGSPRLTKELRLRGWHVGHNRVARVIAENGLGAVRKKQFRITTKSFKGQWVAQNILARQFSVNGPNRVWVSDITYIATAEGWLYLAVVLDLCSRRVVGWCMGTRLDVQLVLQALTMALLQRRPPRGLIFHSDRGCQYASRTFRKTLAHWGIQQSMSRKGDCWDNACAESFFNTLKVELIGKSIYASRTEAKGEIFEYMEVFYNRNRLHSTLGYLSPHAFEQALEKIAS